jgi:predicted O-methyltransferase YrrM
MDYNPELMIAEMESLSPIVMNNVRILAPHNKRDYYYREIVELADKPYFFETYHVIVWAGMRLRPKNILEIGTRNGGSLVQLLSMYHRFDGVRVVGFDVWQELGGPRAVRRNLRRMNIPSEIVTFISGDSRETLPAFKASRPQASFDYILVDGGHTEEIAYTDLENVASLAAPGCILIFDDIGPESYRLIGVWRRFQTSHPDEYHWYEKQWRKGVAWGIRK